MGEPCKDFMNDRGLPSVIPFGEPCKAFMNPSGFIYFTVTTSESKRTASAEARH